MSRSALRTCSGRRARRTLLAITGLLLAGLGTPAAHAAPGVPDAPISIFTETFEFGLGTSVINIENYLGTPIPPGGDRPLFRADGGWDASPSGCNGFLVSFSGNDPECTGANANADVKAMARKVGTVGGDATPDDNHALTARTDGELATNLAELYIPEGIPVAGAVGHYLVAAVDAAAMNCDLSAPQLSFTMSDWSAPTIVDHPLSPAPQNVCTQGSDLGDGMRGGTIYSDASVLSNFDALTLEIRNATGSTGAGTGNDHALDNLAVATADPKLDITGDSVATGATATLTFTVTNTNDLASKEGWSFSGDLPAGLQVVSGATAGRDRTTRATTCPGTTVSAPAGGHTVTAGGSIAAGQGSCTVTLGVTAAGAGAFSVSGAGFTTSAGLRGPGNTTVTFTSPVTPPPPPPPPPAITPLAQCAKGALQLTDVYGRNGRTVLRGVAGPGEVGKQVAIFSTSDGKRVATATVQPDQSFATTAKLPPRAIRDTNGARFQARVGTKRSRSMKFARRMTETVASRLDATHVKIGGRVTKPFAVPRATIVVRGAQSCQSDESFAGVVVASRVKVASNGTWSTTIALPASLQGDKVYLRASTRVRRNTKNPKTFATFTLIQGVALK